MSNSKLVSIISGIVAALGYLSTIPLTGHLAHVIGIAIGIAFTALSAFNEELHDSASTALTFGGIATAVAAGIAAYQTSLPTVVPMIMGLVGVIMASIGKPLGTVPVISASQEPR